jgi:hypothetical protein
VQDRIADARLYKTAAAVINNIVIKPSKGTAVEVIKADTQACDA